MTAEAGDGVAILRIRNCLLVTIQRDLDDESVVAFQDRLTRRIVETAARGVIIDVSALDVVDSFVGRMLANIASVARVLDAVSVIVGIRPAVAITLTELGMSFSGVRTALNVDRGMAIVDAFGSASGRAVARRGGREPEGRPAATADRV